MKSTILAAAALAATLGFATVAQAQTYYYDQYGRVVTERELSRDERRALRAQHRAEQRAQEQGQTHAQQRAQQRAQAQAQQQHEQMVQAEQARRWRDAQRQAQVLGNQGYYGAPPDGILPCAENLHQPQFSSGSMVPCY